MQGVEEEPVVAQKPAETPKVEKVEQKVEVPAPSSAGEHHEPAAPAVHHEEKITEDEAEKKRRRKSSHLAFWKRKN